MLRLLHPNWTCFLDKDLQHKCVAQKDHIKEGLKNLLRMFPYIAQKVNSEMVIYLVEKEWRAVQAEIRKITSEQGQNEIEKNSFRMTYSRNRFSHRHRLTYLSRKSTKGSHQCLFSGEIKLYCDVRRFGYLHDYTIATNLKKRENQKTYLPWNGSISLETVHIL